MAIPNNNNTGSINIGNSSSSSSMSGHMINISSFFDNEVEYDDTFMPSCDSEPSEYVDLTQIDLVRWAFIPLYILVIALSLIGNLMVIWTVCKNRHMRTVTNYYIVNLAISDTLVASFVMPLKVLEYTAPCDWHVMASDTLCALISVTLPVFVFASVLTLIAISVERFYVIVHPINAKIFTSKGRTIKVIFAIWSIAIFVSLPYCYSRSFAFTITSHLGTVSRFTCNDRFDELDEMLYGPTSGGGHVRKGFFLFLFFTMYVLPSAVIVYTCVRIAICLLNPVAILERSSTLYKMEQNKRKVARMVIVVAVTFLLAWTPFYLVSFISQVQPISFLRNSNFLFTMLLTHLVGFTNSTINPFVYTILSDKFRNAFKQIAADLCCLRRYRNTCVGRCCLRFLVLGQGGNGADSVRRRSMAADGHSTNRALSQRAISCLKPANSFNNNGHGGGSVVGGNGESISPDGSTCYRGGEASCFGVTNFASTDSSPPKVHLHQLAEYTVNLSSRPIGLLTTAMNCVTAPDSEQLVVTAAKSVVTPFAKAAASPSSSSSSSASSAPAKTVAYRSDASSRSDGQSSSFYPSSNPHSQQLQPDESMKPQLRQSTDEEAAGQHQQHHHRSYEGRTCQLPTSSKSSNDWLLPNRKSY